MSRDDDQFADEFEGLVRIAAEEKTPAARYRLFRAIRRTEVFFHLKTEQHPATPLLRLSDGTHAMMLYTARSHPDLENTCGGGSFTDALSAASTMTGLDWVILSNRASQWVAIRKQEIPGILAGLDVQIRDAAGQARHQFLENLPGFQAVAVEVAVATPHRAIPAGLAAEI